ncbi:hypothetical protein OPV22_025631 [Ensete ventricosum]|uniref:Pectinesterase inhibitor domain-containing protein n=1 Tax=Ensete ventricosum TaxID=4639 RepID=A0AAV8QEC0_ENSVE|nr:hypothetical protein OPV22_025631 [Ensete ventricosum]
MAMLSAHFFSLFLLLVVKVATGSGDPILSCSQTPYPQVCSSMVSGVPLFAQSETQSGFRDLLLQATLDRTLLAHKHASAMNLAPLDEPAKAAWADCLELFEDTIGHLNRSLGHSSSAEDAQTWLSAAMANQQTCKNGFTDLGTSFPFTASLFMANNISESLSNSLAVNNAMPRGKAPGNRRLLSQGFPGWVKAADRKLLQSSSSTIKANLAVAKDGSGDYKTISEAVAASAKLRSGTSRFVILVKSGIYNENVVITNSMKNIMMIGDGIDATVVTGSKNVQDGSTTFRSATFAVSVQGSFKTYLGRPWQKYSRTVFMKTSLNSLIDPAGWLAWSGSFGLSTLYYGEYMNTGAGADTSKRVTWPGYHVITSSSEASKFTVGSFLSGNSWIPATGVPFSSGL